MKKLPIEKQVCSLEQAKKLREFLGDDAPNGLWTWGLCGYPTTEPVFKLLMGVDIHIETSVEYYPAYTGDEFDLLLPDEIEYSGHCLSFKITKSNGFFWPKYSGELEPFMFDELGDETPARAKAKLAILLLEKKIIKPGDFKF